MLKDIKLSKDTMTKLITVLIVSAIFFLSMSILTDNHDSRKMISDNDGATEGTLCSILSEIKGVGAVNVLVEYGDEDTVCGVIVTAEGAGDPVIENALVKGISTLYDIPASNVIVFEKKEDLNNEEEISF